MVGMATSAAASPLPAGGVTRNFCAGVGGVVEEPEVGVAAGVGRGGGEAEVAAEADPEQRAGWR